MNANGSISKKLESERLAKAVAAALNRRVGQGKAMLPKQLAYHLQRSEQTIWGWLGGHRPPSGTDLIALINFFDASFANEILDGCVVHKLSDRRQLQEAKRRLESAIEAIAWLKAEGE